MRVLRFTFVGEKIATIEVIGEMQRLAEMELAVLGEGEVQEGSFRA